MSTHAHDIDFKKDFTVEPQEGSTVKISGEIPYAELEHERAAAIKQLGKNVKLDGFRAGHVPEKVLVEQIGEMRILSEMAERALSHMYPHIVEAHELEVIGYPQVEITKLAPQNPLGFTATVAVLPEITLPNYKQLAKTANADQASKEVTDEEVATQIKEILRQKLAYERLQKAAAAKAGTETTDATNLPTPESEAAKADAEKSEDEVKAVTDDELPELTDEYVQSLGQPGQFADVADFKAKIKEHLAIEKEQEVTAAHRAKITDAIIAGSEIDLPQVLIDSEIEQMFAQMNEDLSRANLQMDDYLQHIKKTKEDLVTEWKPAAEKRAKLQLILNEIAKKEDVHPDKAELDQQVDQLLEQYKDADENRVRIYVASVLQNEAVMKMLEALK